MLENDRPLGFGLPMKREWSIASVTVTRNPGGRLALRWGLGYCYVSWVFFDSFVSLELRLCFRRVCGGSLSIDGW